MGSALGLYAYKIFSFLLIRRCGLGIADTYSYRFYTKTVRFSSHNITQIENVQELTQ